MARPHFCTRLFALTAVVCTLGGCASTSSTVSTTDAAYGASQERQDISFPDAGSAWLKGGAFVDVEQLRRIGRGMNKNQVRSLVGYPHFSEGLFGPKAWDYLFDFRTGKGDEFVTCQYKVVFKDGLSDAMFWKDQACADYLKPAAGDVAQPVTPAAMQAPPRRFRLGADALFAFDRSAQADILPEGRRQLDALAAELKDKYPRIDNVTVVGHTDRLGSDSHNQALSLARAAAVRDHLIERGLPARSIRAFGVGKTQPVTQCSDSLKRDALIACLQPNRRVEIDVTGSSEP